MKPTVKFDMLEVLFFLQPKNDQPQTLSLLQDAVESRFEVETLEQVSGSPLNRKKIIVRVGRDLRTKLQAAKN